MKRQGILSLSLACIVAAASAYDILWLNTNDGLSIGVEIGESISVSYGNESNVIVYDGESELGQVSLSLLEDLTLGSSDGIVTVRFCENGTRVEYPDYFEDSKASMLSFSMDREKGIVRVDYSGLDPLSLRVAGETSQGQLKVYTDAHVNIILDNVNMSNDFGSCINVQSTNSSGVTFTLVGVSNIADSKNYTNTPSGEKEKGAVYSTQGIEIEGEGTLYLKGNNKHALCSENEIALNSGNVIVTKAKSDGIHGEGFIMNGGAFSCSGTKGDAIDAASDKAFISGGDIAIELGENDIKGITADKGISITGGNVAINIASDQSKGIKTKGDIVIGDDANIEIAVAGNAVVVDGDPSYCTGIKLDGDFYITGGKVKIDATGQGTRGISANGAANFDGGEATFTATGTAVEYTDIDGIQDSYSATCVSSDSTIYVRAGRLTSLFPLRQVRD